MHALFPQAVQNFTLGRHIEAKAILDSIGKPYRDAEYFRLLGLVLAHLHEHEDALSCFKKAVSLAPGDAANQLNLADHYRNTGRLSLAVQHYRKAASLDPSSAATLALADLLVRTGEVRDSQMACAFANGRVDLMVASAIALDAIGTKDEAIRLLEHVATLAPTWDEPKIFLRKWKTERVRVWHFPMMRDAGRNEAYEAALSKAVGPETHVLEIGTGSGLLAMMAARAGAARVTTCEAIGVIADTAAKIVLANGLANRVHVVAKTSQAAQLGTDLPAKADVLVAEIIGDDMLAEGVLPATLDARRRLLKPDAKLIPCRIASIVALVGGHDLEKLITVRKEAGFDLSAFNTFTPLSLSLTTRGLQIVRLSEKQAAFEFDLASDQFSPQERVLEFTANKTSRCVGILQWVRLNLDQEIIFENEPTEEFQTSGWRPVLFPFETPIDVLDGQTLRVAAKHNIDSQAFFPIY